MDENALERKNVEFSNGEEGRVYFNVEEKVIVPSVTTVTNFRIDEEKDAAINGWKDRYDGTADWKSPHWEKQMKYKGWRGTLGHYNILNDLQSIPMTDEEEDAKSSLESMEYDGSNAFDSAIREVEWAYNSFFDDVADDKGISSSSVLEAEKYVIHPSFQYAGQFDLLYEDDDGDTVVADLKLSSGIRLDYKLQTAAYAKAVEENMDISVDRIEVIRLHPDTEAVEVEDNTDWNRTIDSYFEQFLGCCYKAKEFAPSIDVLEGDDDG